jgi:filamentous hemagglutinin family protein
MKKILNTSLSLRKLILSALVAAPLATLPSSLWALPSFTPGLASGNLTSSSSSTTIIQSPTTLDITTPDRTVLKWVNFGSGTDTVAAGESIIYNLPTASSSVLNMVTGGTLSTIDGTLTSNGKILLLNPAGITLNGQITAAGASLSTRPETEFYYVANGDLAYNGTAANNITVAGTITVGSAGNVVIQGKTVSVAGNIDALSTTVTASNAGTASIGGAGAITIGNTTNKYGTLTVNTDGGTLTVAAGAGIVTVAGNSASLNSANGGVAEGAGTFQIGNSDATLTIAAGTGAVNLPAVQAATSGKTLTANITAGSVTAITAPTNKLSVGATTTTGGLTATTTAGDLTLKASNIGGALTATAGAGDLLSGGTVVVKAGSAISLSASGAGKKITYAGSGDLTFGTITSNATGTVTLTTTGALPLPAITTQTLSATSSAGAITQTGALAVTGTATFNSGTSTTLGTVTNDFGKVVLQGGPSGATIVDATGLTLEKGTSASGDVSITAGGAVVIGSAAGDSVLVSGNTTINTAAANGAITDLTDNGQFLGSLTLTTGSGAITLDGSAANGVGLKSAYGQINITTTGAATVFEQTTLNLGPITANSLKAYSATGIINSGKLAIATTTVVGAGTAAAPGDVNLNFTSPTVGAGNAMAGAISFLSDLELLGSATVGNYLVKSATVINEGAITVNVPANIYAEGLKGNLSITGASIVNGANPIFMSSGKLTLNAAGAITANYQGTVGAIRGNQFSAVAVTTGGDVNVASSGSFTVDATLTGTGGVANANVATFTSASIYDPTLAGDITLGSITSNYNGAAGLKFDASAGGSVKDSVAGLTIFGAVNFQAKNDVTINKSGHNFGAVTINSTSDSKTLTLVESGTLKLAAVGASNKKDAINLTSTNGDIIQTGSIKTSGDNTKIVTLRASNGKVTATNAGNAVEGRWDVTSAGDASIVNTGFDTLLGNITTSGLLSVSDTTAAKNVKQVSGTKVFAFGDTTVSAGTSGGITLSNTGNNFGGLILTSASGDIAVTESGTLNVKSAQTSGKITLVSENSNIIDTVDATVANNSISNGAGAIGTASFTANNGSVTLDNPGNVYSTVSVNTKADALLTQTTGDITFGASVVGGALTVTTSAAGANIKQSGTLSVTGNVSLTTNAGAVIFGDTSNSFGAVRFKTGLTSTLTENSTFNLNSGSVATAPVTINTNGNFITSGVGGSSFTSSLTINAIGTIVPSAGSLLVTGTFTVFSNNTKDLSALSKSGNLAGNDPTNLGTGTYVAPSP